MAERFEMTVTVTGPMNDLAGFVQLCKTIQRLCDWGSSRTIRFPVDGDGAAALRFDFGDLDVSKVEPAEVGGEDEIRLSGLGY